MPSATGFEIRVWSVVGEVAISFASHASFALDKARVLESPGWQLHVTDSAGHQFDPSDFDGLSSLAEQMA
jgi:hypothetical protein